MNLVKITLIPSTVNSIETVNSKEISTNVPIKSEKEFSSVILSLLQTYSGTRDYILVTDNSEIISVKINVVEESLGLIESSILVILGSEMHSSIKLNDSSLSYLINLTKSYNNEFV